MLNEKGSEYIKNVCSHVKWRQAHKCIEEELSSHITDQCEAFIQDGMDNDMAYASAIREMGDPVLVGEEMNKVYRPRISLPVVVTFAILLVSGFAVRLSLGQSDLPQIIVTAASLCIMALLWRFLSVKWLMDNARHVTAVMIVLPYICFILSCLFPLWKVNGFNTFDLASLYLTLFQPLIIALTLWKSQSQGIAGLAKVCGLVVLMLLPCLFQPFLFVAALILAVDAVLIIYAVAAGWLGEKKTAMLIFIVAAFAAAVLLCLVLLKSWQIKRLAEMLGISDGNASYQSVTVRDILASCSFFGGVNTASLSQSSLSMLHTVEWSIDYSLVVLAAKTGSWIYYAVALFVLSFLILMARECIKRGGMFVRFISLAIIFTLAVQWASYFAANLGIIDLRLPMPFISAGSLSMLTNMILMGIIMNVTSKGFYYDCKNHASLKTAKR